MKQELSKIVSKADKRTFIRALPTENIERWEAYDNAIIAYKRSATGKECAGILEAEYVGETADRRALLYVKAGEPVRLECTDKVKNLTDCEIVWR